MKTKNILALAIILIIAISFGAGLTACSDHTTIVEPHHDTPKVDTFFFDWDSICDATAVITIDTCAVGGLGHRDPGHNQNGHIDTCLTW